jgi:hypothetical protein
MEVLRRVDLNHTLVTPVDRAPQAVQSFLVSGSIAFGLKIAHTAYSSMGGVQWRALNPSNDPEHVASIFMLNM